MIKPYLTKHNHTNKNSTAINYNSNFLQDQSAFSFASISLLEDARFKNGEPPAVPRFQKVRNSKTSAVPCIQPDRPERNSPS